MRFRIQVERGPLTKIVIFKPNEQHLPDEQKTYFTEVSMGLLGDDKTDFLEPEELFMDGNKVGIDRNRLQERLGHSDLSKLIMPAEVFREFLNSHREKEEE